MARSFGVRQPSKASQMAAFRYLLASAADLDALPPVARLAHIYRMPIEAVHYELRQARRSRANG